jgi:hypothetical protein
LLYLLALFCSPLALLLALKPFQIGVVHAFPVINERSTYSKLRISERERWLRDGP